MKFLHQNHQKTNHRKIHKFGEKSQYNTRKEQLKEGLVGFQNTRDYMDLKGKEIGYFRILESQTKKLTATLKICKTSKNGDELKDILKAELQSAEIDGRALREQNQNPDIIMNMSEQRITGLRNALLRFEKANGIYILDLPLYPGNKHAKFTLREYVASDIEASIDTLVHYQLSILDSRVTGKKYEY